MQEKNDSGKSNRSKSSNKKQPSEDRRLTIIGIQEDKPLLKRTNSIHVNDKGEEEPIRPSTRHYVDGHSYSDIKAQDAFKVAIFSQEASRNFSRNYHKKIQTEEYYKPHEGVSTSTMDPEIVKNLIAKSQYYPNVTKHDEALAKLFENKDSPHVVAVVEGQRDTLKEKFTLEKEKTYPYSLHAFHIEGTNSRGHTDYKQNMHFYVRDDMAGAVTLSQAMIDEGTKNQFPVGDIQFETEKKKYSLLVPHIPNIVAKDAEAADQAFRDYGKKVESERTVVGYIGDTNYNKMMQDCSSPSVGGNQANGKFVAPASSGATKFTYFMQAVFFDTAQKSVLMAQPSMLNQVNLQLDTPIVKKGKEVQDNTATDHPPIQINIVVDSPIKMNTITPSASLLSSSSDTGATTSLASSSSSRDIDTTTPSASLSSSSSDMGATTSSASSSSSSSDTDTTTPLANVLSSSSDTSTTTSSASLLSSSSDTDTTIPLASVSSSSSDTSTTTPSANMSSSSSDTSTTASNFNLRQQRNIRASEVNQLQWEAQRFIKRSLEREKNQARSHSQHFTTESYRPK